MAAPPPHKKPKMDEKGRTEEISTIYIDRNGNLKLVVGPKAVPIQVDANALRRASKVFDRMLFGPFRESHQTDNWTVELPEDDPEALRVIFHAIHGNFRMLPWPLTLSKVYDITVMANKYAMVGSLEPWRSLWMLGFDKLSPLKSDDKEETNYKDIQRLFILYHLGTADKFRHALPNLAMKSKANQSGDLLFEMTTDISRKGQPLPWSWVGPLPMEIITFAKSLRYSNILRLLGGLSTTFASCTSQEDKEDIARRCHSTALGLMIRHLVRANLWPIPKTYEVQLSVHELSSIIDKIREEVSSQVLKKCKCYSGKRVSGRCQITLPLVSEDAWTKELQEKTTTRFFSHFLNRDKDGVVEN